MPCERFVFKQGQAVDAGQTQMRFPWSYHPDLSLGG